jgi:2-phosphoglycerate kinase
VRLRLSQKRIDAVAEWEEKLTVRAYWIGGSPCCGKSTLSEMLVREFGFRLYKVDDQLDRYREIGAAANIPIMRKFQAMNLDETWLRDIQLQVVDEFEFYRHALNTIVGDLKSGHSEGPVVIEGAAILPEFAVRAGIEHDRYVCMVPTRDFQVSKFAEREWVKQYLSGCTDPERAFANWMERDVLFAERVKKYATTQGLNVITTDGSTSIEETYSLLKVMFGLA